ncbi:MAG: T9SS type A sorting domain-containing protein [Chlorobi bacterium]|nr:T9SS type A sorting domain-containing protein [Chlorobiota bacterium]
MTDNNGDITFSFSVPARHNNALAAVVDISANQCIAFHELISITQSTLPDLSISKAQVIQVQQTTELVAGKPLGVKVQIGTDREIINAFGVAVAVNGDTIRQFYKFDKKNIDKNFEFISPRDTISLPDGIPVIVYLFVPDTSLTPGKYNLDIIVDPPTGGGTGSITESNEDNNVMSIPVEVVETHWGNDGEREMSILFQAFDEFSRKWTQKFNSWADSAADFIRNVYPMADDQLKITKVEKSFDLPPVLTKDSLTEEEWQEYIVNAYTFLRTKYPLQDRIVLVPNLNWFSSGRFDSDSFSHRASVGLTYSGIQDMFIALPHHFKTAAHELGHTFGLHRADFGDAEEYHLFFIGVQVYDGVDAKSYAMKSFGTINSWNQTQDIYCFMSNGSLRSNRYYWIDQKDYEKLLANQKSFAGSGGLSKNATGRSILISGIADWDTGSIELDPFTILPNAKRSPSMSSQSEYVFIAKATDGTEISRFYYQPSYTVLGLDESGEQAPTYLKEHFAFVMPFPVSAKSITVEKNGKEIITRVLTSNKPIVQITYPKPGITQGNSDFNITWTGSDPDGDKIWYDLYFSSDLGVTWKMLAYRTTETSFPMKIDELDNRNTYLVKLEFTDGFNLDSTVMSGPFRIDKTVAVNDPPVVAQPWLSSNYPNPFAHSTMLKFHIPRTDEVRLEVFDALGRLVRVLVNGTRPHGTYTVRFDPGSIPPGVYIARLKTSRGIFLRRMIYSR